MTDLLGIPLSALAPGAIAGIACLLVLTGRLVPRRTYDDEVGRANQWMAEARIKDQQIAEKDTQLAEKDVQLRHMGEVGQTMRLVLSSLQSLSRKEADPR